MKPESSDDVTARPEKNNSSDELPVDIDRLLPLVYDELRQMAAIKMAGEARGNSIQATALVHEVFFRLAGSESNPVVWDNRAHFFAAAAEAMRRILIDAARRRRAAKRGGGTAASTIDIEQIASPVRDDDLLDVHDVLDRLSAVDPQAATLVKLRFFAGMSMTEIAAAMDMSVRSAQNVWAYARAWLRNELGR